MNEKYFKMLPSIFNSSYHFCFVVFLENNISMYHYNYILYAIYLGLLKLIKQLMSIHDQQLCVGSKIIWHVICFENITGYYYDISHILKFLSSLKYQYVFKHTNFADALY